MLASNQQKQIQETKDLRGTVAGSISQVEAKVGNIQQHIEDHVQRLEKLEEMVAGNATENIDKLIKERLEAMQKEGVAKVSTVVAHGPPLFSTPPPRPRRRDFSPPHTGGLRNGSQADAPLLVNDRMK